MRLHHVQVSAPAGGEVAARRFYGELLGLTEVAKPASLGGRGGCWFREVDDAGRVVAELHVGVEETFVPARKAHPAFVVDDVTTLDRLVDRLEQAGHVPNQSERTTFPGYERVHVADPFGNRVELLAPAL